MTPQRRRAFRHLSLGLVLAASLQPAAAQTVGSPYAVLEGRWVRPDGGYTIYIRGVDAGGRVAASYANPRPLPFEKAQAALEGRTLKLQFELRAGGYAGSAYTLLYNPASDTLDGEYFQAVARQTYPVRFHRLPGP
ncbi:hypothetical protein [Accumulibacter sp.]|uniref:hypothetical protein n=1 Tax=Accumulibacter sp. TaxID=2053492 RepID=UPI0025E55E70|nr:hypothetical protein [Accumulibacter sp.]MCM8614196.1 hypothetical protein [Accumulibacter sp.]MCM8638035.1 hypothetical protein [Accumulibacter sp.]MCM8641321.1 hypothetical protein [Accumulibacter sp.]